MRAIRIKPHHFVDIIADYGVGEVASGPNAYGNDVPGVTAALLADAEAVLEIEMGADDICKPCVHNIEGVCDDPLGPELGPEAPTLKRELNLLLDQRWCERLGLAQGDHLTAHEMCERIRARKGDIRGIYRELPPGYGEDKERALDLGVARYLGSG